MLSWLLFFPFLVTCNGSWENLGPPMDMDQYNKAVGGDPMAVFRGEDRGPAEISAYTVDGKPKPGFYPKNRPIKPEQWGLYSHVEGGIGNTAFISTSKSLTRAAEYAWKSANGPGGYIYRITTSSTFLDVNRSLRQWTRYGNLEYAVMGGIPFSQVEAYIEVTPEVWKLVNQERFSELQWVTNDKYIPVPQELRGSRAVPELAGFPDKHPFWQHSPWKEIRQSNGGTPPDLEATFNKYLASEKRPTPDVRGTGKSSPSVDSKIIPGSNAANPGVKSTTGEKGQLVKGKATADPIEVLELTEQRAAKEFPKKASRFGLNPVASRQGKTLEALRLSLKQSPAIQKITSAGAMLKKLPIKGGFYVASLGMLVTAFFGELVHDASPSERAAMILSVVPFLGCAAQAVANKGKSKDEDVRTALCFVADTLIVTPAWPLGVLLHIVMAFLGTSERRTIRPGDSVDLQRRRAKGWAKYLPMVLQSINDRRFYDGLESQFQAEVTAVIFAASEAKALAEVATANNYTQTTANDTQTTANKLIHDEVCAAVSEVKKRLLQQWGAAAVKIIAEEAKEYDKKFFKTALQKVKIYIDKNRHVRRGVFDDPADWIRKELEKDINLFPDGKAEFDDLINGMAAFYVSRHTARPCLSKFDWNPPKKWYGTLGNRPQTFVVHGKPASEEPVQLAWAAAQLRVEKMQAVRQWAAAWAKARRPGAGEEEMAHEQETAALLEVINRRLEWFKHDVTMWARRNKMPKPDDWAVALVLQAQAHFNNEQAAELRAKHDEDEDEE